MNAKRFPLVYVAACALLVLASADAVAAGAARAVRGMGPGWVAVAPQRLAGMRGGFQLPGGMQLSFGIERVVYVNDRMVASTRVVIPNVSRMTAAEATALREFQEGVVVQVGEGNRVSAGAHGGLVVQNSLDGQAIRAVTRLDVGVDTLGAFQALNTQQTLHDALLLSPGTP